MKKFLFGFAFVICAFSNANALTPISKDDILNGGVPGVALMPISKDDILNGGVPSPPVIALMPISKDDILNQSSETGGLV